MQEIIRGGEEDAIICLQRGRAVRAGGFEFGKRQKMVKYWEWG